MPFAIKQKSRPPKSIYACKQRINNNTISSETPWFYSNIEIFLTLEKFVSISDYHASSWVIICFSSPTTLLIIKGNSYSKGDEMTVTMR